MKKLQILGLAVFAVFAFSVVAVASASAHTWEEDGSAITTPTAGTTSGEILLEDMNAFGKPDVLCTGTFTGTFGAGAAGEITSVEDLEGHVASATKLEWLDCVFTAKGLCEGTLVLVMPEGLSWDAEIQLIGGKLTIVILNAGYTVLCVQFLGNIEDTCTGTTGAELKNGTEGEVLGEFLENNAEVTPAVNCSVGGVGQGLQASIGAGLLKLSNGLTLSAS